MTDPATTDIIQLYIAVVIAVVTQGIDASQKRYQNFCTDLFISSVRDSVFFRSQLCNMYSTKHE